MNMILQHDLQLRYSAATLFDTIESLPDDDIVVDFRNVRTITRAFAHEYLCRKKKTQKRIREVNMPENIRRMFRVVETVTKKTPLIDLEKITKIDMK